jgi:uncharacterized protein YqfB (UPF0267 family)
MECRLPQEKIDKVNKVLASAKHRKNLKLRELQSLIEIYPDLVGIYLILGDPQTKNHRRYVTCLPPDI